MSIPGINKRLVEPNHPTSLLNSKVPDLSAIVENHIFHMRLKHVGMFVSGKLFYTSQIFVHNAK